MHCAKVAEGIDFSDNKGRVAIITGIPFAPFMDAWVQLKKEVTVVIALLPV
jgi:Rad3-related DNA helicase